MSRRWSSRRSTRSPNHCVVTAAVAVSRTGSRQQLGRPAAPSGRCSRSRCSGTGCRPARRVISSSLGSGVRASRSVASSRNPGVQNPHCRPWHSRNARCTGRQLAVGPGQALDGGDLGAVDHHREREARPHRLAVEQHRAGTAHPVLAADVGAGEPQVVAQHVGQQPPRRHPRPPAPRRYTVTHHLVRPARSGHGARPPHVAAVARPMRRRATPRAVSVAGQVAPVVAGGVDVVGRGSRRRGDQVVERPSPPASAGVRSTHHRASGAHDRYAARPPAGSPSPSTVTVSATPARA